MAHARDFRGLNQRLTAQRLGLLEGDLQVLDLGVDGDVVVRLVPEGADVAADSESVLVLIMAAWPSAVFLGSRQPIS